MQLASQQRPCGANNGPEPAVGRPENAFPTQQEIIIAGLSVGSRATPGQPCYGLNLEHLGQGPPGSLARDTSESAHAGNSTPAKYTYQCVCV